MTPEPEKIITAISDAIVGESGCVSITGHTVRDKVVFNLEFPSEFHGRAIGQNGSTIDGIRLIMALAGRKAGSQVSIRINSPDGRSTSEVIPFTPNLNWNPAWVSGFASRLAAACFLNPVQVDVVDRASGETGIKFWISRSEPVTVPAAELEAAFQAVFKSIGMTCGRRLMFRIATV